MLSVQCPVYTNATSIRGICWLAFCLSPLFYLRKYHNFHSIIYCDNNVWEDFRTRLALPSYESSTLTFSDPSGSVPEGKALGIYEWRRNPARQWLPVIALCVHLSYIVHVLGSRVGVPFLFAKLNVNRHHYCAHHHYIVLLLLWMIIMMVVLGLYVERH